MNTVNSLPEAAEWFLEHSNGTVICVNADGEPKECSAFPEAWQWFDSFNTQAEARVNERKSQWNPKSENHQ